MTLASTGTRSHGLVLGVVILWGLNWPVMKIGLEYIQPLWFAAARAVMGSVCLFALLAILGRLDTPNRKDYPVVLSVGILQIVGFMGLVHWGLLYVEPGQSAILAYTTPLWVVPLAAIVLKEGFSKLKFLGLLLGLGGLVLLLRPWGPNIGGQINVGDGLLLAAAASWAVAIVHVRGHDWHGDPLLLAPWQMALGAPILALLATILEGPPKPSCTTEFWLVIAYNGPIGSAFCFWAWITANRTLPATTSALASLGVPVVGLFASSAMTGETLSLNKIMGLGMIIPGVALGILADFRHAKRSGAVAGKP